MENKLKNNQILLSLILYDQDMTMSNMRQDFLKLTDGIKQKYLLF